MKKKYIKIRGDIHKIVNEGQVERFNPGKIFQRKKGPVQNINQMYGHVSVVEPPKNIQGGYLKLQFIPSLQIKTTPVFGASLHR